jgi:hypothetical protein
MTGNRFTSLGDPAMIAQATLACVKSTAAPPAFQSLVGNPAIDAGAPFEPAHPGTACAAHDQRGISDTDGDGTAACDIGAYAAPQGVDKVEMAVYLPSIIR